MPEDDRLLESTANGGGEQQKAASSFSVLPPDLPQESNFYNVPDSATSNLISEVLGAGENIADLKNRKKQISHSTKYLVTKSGIKGRFVEFESTSAKITIEIADIDKLTGSNKPAKKLFVLSLIKANEQAIFNGQLTKGYISFPLKELVDIGFYKTPQSARAGFKSGMDVLTSLKIMGCIQHTKKRKSSIEALAVLFTGYIIKNGQCTVKFNPDIDWSFIVQYFTILPRYYFKLNNRASDLLLYIFYLARQHANDIEKRGYFTISFRAIQHRLQLPSEKNNDNPYRTIVQPIDEAIEKIEEEHSLLYNNTEFSLLPEKLYGEYANIMEYLDNGYLKVSLAGAFAETYIARSKDTQKQIEQAKKQHDRITEKAKAINKAKALENAEMKEMNGDV